MLIWQLAVIWFLPPSESSQIQNERSKVYQIESDLDDVGFGESHGETVPTAKSLASNLIRTAVSFHHKQIPILQ